VLSDSRRLGGTQSIGFLEEYCCKAVDESTAFITREMLDASIEAYNKVIDPITEKSIELWKSLAYTGDNPLHVMIDVGRVSDSTVLIAIEDMGKYALIRYIKELPKDPLPQQTREVQNLLRHTYFTDLYIDAIGLGKHMAESLEEEFGAKINLIESFQNPVKDRLVSDMYVAIANLRILIPPIESSVEAEKLYNQLHSLRRKYSEKSHQEQYVGDKNTHDDYAFCLAIGAQSLGDSIPRQGIMAIGKDTSSLLSQDKTGKMEIIGITPKKDETKAPNMSDEEYVKKFTSREYDEPAPKERPCTSDKCVELSKKMGKPIMMKLVQNSQAKAHGSEWLCEVCWGQFYHAEDK
jgi:phage FluMu gp28-like protein